MIESFRDFAPTESVEEQQVLGEMNAQLKAFVIKDLIAARDNVQVNPYLAYCHLSIVMINVQICADRTLWERVNQIRHGLSQGHGQQAHQALVSLCNELS